MPTDDECAEDEKPRHPVKISKGFWMGRDEVTVGEYSGYVDKTGSGIPPARDFNDAWKDQDHPIVNVTWADAASYCGWAGGRLPTEAEWEYAARGGKNGLKFPNGNDLTPTEANFLGDGTSPVGTFGSNGYGLYDMAGNVWEWTADRYGPYGEGEQENPQGSDEEGGKVLRGGSWIGSLPRYLRCSVRSRYEPDNRLNYVGFRCVREVFP